MINLHDGQGVDVMKTRAGLAIDAWPLKCLMFYLIDTCLQRVNWRNFQSNIFKLTAFGAPQKQRQ